jgi:hypothetical protein
VSANVEQITVGWDYPKFDGGISVQSYELIYD